MSLSLGEASMNEVASTAPKASTDIAKIVYVLYLIGLFTAVTAVIGVVIAYIYRDDAPDWLKTHYEFQIRTFWIGLLYFIIAGILCAILIGFLLLAAVAVWWIVRCAKGLKYVDQRAAYPNYTTWTV
jgi:uncharacterized membrane protein